MQPAGTRPATARQQGHVAPSPYARPVPRGAGVLRAPTPRLAGHRLLPGLLAKPFLQLVVGEPEHPAVGVIDDLDFPGAQQPGRQDQRADRVVIDHRAEVPDYVDVGVGQPQHLLDVGQPGIGTGDDGDLGRGRLPAAGIETVGDGGVGAQRLVDKAHGLSPLSGVGRPGPRITPGPGRRARANPGPAPWPDQLARPRHDGGQQGIRPSAGAAKGNAMERRILGATGISVSEMALGAMMFGAGGNPDHNESIRVIHAALDAGINLVDTADVYSSGESETIVGQAIKGRRDEVVLATKFGLPMGADPNRSGGSRRWISHAVEDSLRRLGTDHIDLYQMHRPDPATDVDESLSALSDLVHAGKVRAIGSSTFPAELIVEAQWTAERRGHQRFLTEQPRYSILNRVNEAAVLPTA